MRTICQRGTAASTTGIDGTDEPGTLAAEVARRPGDRDALLYGRTCMQFGNTVTRTGN